MPHCNIVCIGQTKMNIGIRYKEHTRNSRLYKIDIAALAAHVGMRDIEFKIKRKLLKYNTYPKELTVWKMLFIRKVKMLS